MLPIAALESIGGYWTIIGAAAAGLLGLYFPSIRAYIGAAIGSAKPPVQPAIVVDEDEDEPAPDDDYIEITDVSYRAEQLAGTRQMYLDVGDLETVKVLDATAAKVIFQEDEPEPVE